MIEDFECSLCYNQACKILDMDSNNHKLDIFMYKIIVKRIEVKLHKDKFCFKYKKKKELEKMKA